MIEHLKSPQAASAWCDGQREQNQSMGFVPTMGALHDGHISLIERARRENTRVIASIFVNPLQFNNPEDLEKYPRDEAGDIAQLDNAGADAVFTGSTEQFLGDARQLQPRELKDPSTTVSPSPLLMGLSANRNRSFSPAGRSSHRNMMSQCDWEGMVST